MPVLSAMAGGIFEIIREGETALFAKPNDIEHTLRIIEYVIDHPEIMKEYGINGRKCVEENYSRESVAKQHISLYESILQVIQNNNFDRRRGMENGNL